MRKNHKILLGIFALGLLLCGIGGGILFGEFTALNYGGEFVYRTDEPTTEIFEISLADCGDGFIQVNNYRYDLMSMVKQVKVDDSLEEGIVQIETTYDPKQVQPFFRASGFAETTSTGCTGYLELSFYARHSAFPMVMAMKDLFLDDLKSNTVRSYSYEDIFSLTISAAPETASRLMM